MIRLYSIVTWPTWTPPKDNWCYLQQSHPLKLFHWKLHSWPWLWYQLLDQVLTTRAKAIAWCSFFCLRAKQPKRHNSIVTWPIWSPPRNNWWPAMQHVLLMKVGNIIIIYIVNRKENDSESVKKQITIYKYCKKQINFKFWKSTNIEQMKSNYIDFPTSKIGTS